VYSCSDLQSSRQGSRNGVATGAGPRRPVYTRQGSSEFLQNDVHNARPHKLTGSLGYTDKGTLQPAHQPAPHRHCHLPRQQFKKLLAPGKIGQILCLGNITDRETYEFLRAIAPDLQIVKGDFDVEAPNLALSKVVTHGSLRIGFTHGHTIIPPGDGDSLLIAARQMDVDVLLWGGTHKFEAYEMEGKFFVNPGSATGAMTTGWWTEDEDPTPSFVLMDVSSGPTCNLEDLAC
jgi:vacuolar protein sorting-associated protein 29